ncbi:hypothetical protein C2U70_05060 [Bradyrhizobium guangdongense]|uniref:hypothetical protein n=1 Tax=Bradyrhizobium guangdongense TaxID=1325090 RepID=UPI001129AEF7|nr:hypothetical protein [Bradyrhizobium guangdongense]TPQ40468.1 hypothetical protein C2U70_05060 [Bradyrhizobium guangdongense]
MIRSIATVLLLIAGFSGFGAVAQVNGPDPATFTGLYRNEGVNGQPETVTVTDGKSYVRLTEQEYRAAGYQPAYDTLLTRIVRRAPVRALGSKE